MATKQTMQQLELKLSEQTGHKHTINQGDGKHSHGVEVTSGGGHDHDVVIQPHGKHSHGEWTGFFGENTQNITAIPTVPQYIYLIPIIKL